MNFTLVILSIIIVLSLESWRKIDIKKKTRTKHSNKLMSFLPNHLKPNSSEIKTGKTKKTIIPRATSHPKTFMFFLKNLIKIKSKTAFQ